MANELTLIPVSEITVMAKAVAASGLFGIKTQDQALALMLIAQAEGRHPALAARDYDIIQNKPSKKSEAMLRDFISAGGKVEWHTLDDVIADATFSHPQGGTVRITWDMNRAKLAGLFGKDNWKKHPRQMLRSRVVSEGVRTVCPAATSGMYVPEEVQDFEKPVTIEQEPIEAKTEPKIIERPKAETTATLTEEAKAFAQEIELADSQEKLSALITRYAPMTGQLALKLPKWHSKLMAMIEKQRGSFEPTETTATLTEEAKAFAQEIELIRLI